MAYTFYDFSFRYMDNQGKYEGIFGLRGEVNEEGIILDDALLRFSDIHDIVKKQDKLVFILYPAVAVDWKITQHVVHETTSLVIDVPISSADVIKSIIDQRFTASKIQQVEKEMINNGTHEHFKCVKCPRCESSINISYLPDTLYNYCEYCSLVFTRHGSYVNNTEDFKECPSCHYFNRVQYFTRVQIYYYGKDRAFNFDREYLCDSCALEHVKQDYIKNLPFLIGLPFNFSMYSKIKSNSHPTLSQLTIANGLSVKNKYEEAREYYQDMLLHFKAHPALHYNFGLSELEYSKKLFKEAKDLESIEKAKKIRNSGAREMRETIRGCCNFTPALEYMKKHADLELFIPKRK